MTSYAPLSRPHPFCIPFMSWERNPIFDGYEEWQQADGPVHSAINTGPMGIAKRPLSVLRSGLKVTPVDDSAAALLLPANDIFRLSIKARSSDPSL